MEKKRLVRDDRINLQAGRAKGRQMAKIAEDPGESSSAICREIIDGCTYRDCRHACSNR